MPGFWREYSGALVFSALLHAALAAGFIFAALFTWHRAAPLNQPLPIDAVVVDAQVLRAAQHQIDEEAAAKARAIADAQAAAQAAVEQERQAVQEQAAAKQRAAQAAAEEETERAVAAEKAQQREVQQRAAQHQAEEQRAAEAKQAEQRHAQEQRQAEERKQAEQARLDEAKRAEAAKHAADLKAKAEAELREQLNAEEHASAVAKSPLRDQYIARLRQRITAAWIRPDSARAGLDCLVSITQLPGGEVTDVHVTQCNGDAASRQSIENAVLRASPLPPPGDPSLFDRNLVIRFHPED